jgi:hypothetical protein
MRKYPEAGISHDKEDAPHYSHRTVIIYNSLLKSKILCIEDDDKTHYPFLKQWNGMEIDIENQVSINNGTLGLDVAIHRNNKPRFEYLVRLKIEEMQKVIDDQGVIGFSNHNKKIIFLARLPKTDEIQDFVNFKKDTDNFIKKKHLYPKAWSVQ